MMIFCFVFYDSKLNVFGFSTLCITQNKTFEVTLDLEMMMGIFNNFLSFCGSND